MKILNLQKRILCTTILMITISCASYAQSYYMHEVAEDSNGESFIGIIGTIFFVGIIWIISRCIGGYSEIKKDSEARREKRDFEMNLMEERLKKNPNKYLYQNNTYWKEGYLKANSQITTSSNIEVLYNKTINDLINEYTKLDPFSEQAKNIMRQIGYYQYLEWNNEGLKKEGRRIIKIIDTQCHDLNDWEFEEECIKLYGNYAELVDFCLIIFEDGFFRIIPFQDRRYKPLKTFIKQNYPERINMANKLIGENNFLSTFFACNLEHLPKAKQMEKHGMLKQNFLGSYYFALIAYKNKKTKPYGANSENDFIGRLGFNTAMYLHKMLKRPLPTSSYYSFKAMEKLGISREEYIKKNQWERRQDGIYNKLYGFLGKNDNEARMTIKHKLGFSFEDIQKEVNAIEWHL